MFDRDDRVALVKRALAHLESRTTDQAPDTMLIPISSYLDPDLWQSEMDTIFRRKPLALAATAELPHGGDYKAMEILGIPVLIVRGYDGTVRTFLNVCRHRGAQLCSVGSGNRRRFRCPYHAWTYDDHGTLVAVLRADTVGDIPQEEYGLRALPTAERAGIIFVVLTPDEPIDIDDWLGDFSPELDGLALQDWHFYRRTEFPGPNWKLSYDGYLEGYHFQTLHKLTFGTNNITNLMVADTFGVHQRVGFATKSLPKLRDLPENEWDLPDALAPIYTLFPNVSIAGSWQDHVMITQVLPGTTPAEHLCVQIILTRRPVETDADRTAADAFADMMLRGTGEDYVVAYGAQANLTSGANTHLTFGRNEIALQHQHRSINRLMGRD